MSLNLFTSQPLIRGCVTLSLGVFYLLYSFGIPRNSLVNFICSLARSEESKHLFH